MPPASLQKGRLRRPFPVPGLRARLAAIPHLRLQGPAFPRLRLRPDTDDVKIDAYGSTGDYLASGIDGMSICIHGNAQTNWARS